MKLLVAADTMFYRAADNTYWCKTIYEYSFWQRYLEVFEEIIIISRTFEEEINNTDQLIKVSGPKIKVIELPGVRGLKEYFWNINKIISISKGIMNKVDCGLFRLPSIPAQLVLNVFKKTGKPYSLEVVADPQDAYSTNQLAAFIFTKLLKNDTKRANGVSYVTKEYLQSKYPSKSIKQKKINNIEYFHSYYSTIDLEESFFGVKRNYKKNKKLSLVHVANHINNDMKGHSICLKVVHFLLIQGYKVDITFIGDGKLRTYYEQVANELGIAEYVSFVGLKSDKSEIRDILMKSDLFLFPTKAEGLPRALIEAMATGLPCLSTRVNGIPELLEEEYLFDPNDFSGFTNKIKELFDLPEKLNLMSSNNIIKAKEYKIDNLRIRRNQYYKKLKKLTEKANEARG